MVSGRREETVYIRSALVSPVNSEALLRALQTAKNPDDYYIPPADDDREIDDPGFELRGWVNEDTLPDGIDDQDPWAGDIRFPGPRLADFVTNSMALAWDVDGRAGTFAVEGGNKELIWSQVWGGYRDKNEEDDEPESGRWLRMSYDWLVVFLKETKMDLIVKVQIVRRFRRAKYESYKNEEYSPPKTKVFLIKSDGEICSL